MEWSERKNKINIKKHGISFAEAQEVFNDPNAIEFYDKAHSAANEDRYIIISKCEANSVPDTEIDTSDCPPLTKNQLSQMRPCHLINRDMWQPKKKVLNIRIDADVLESLRSMGKGWQTKVNNILRQAVASGML